MGFRGDKKSAGSSAKPSGSAVATPRDTGEDTMTPADLRRVVEVFRLLQSWALEEHDGQEG